MTCILLGHKENGEVCEIGLLYRWVNAVQSIISDGFTRQICVELDDKDVLFNQSLETATLQCSL